MVNTPYQQKAGGPGGGVGADASPLHFEHEDAQTADRISPLLTGLSEFRQIKTAKATQRLGWFEQFRGATFAATNSRAGNGFTVAGSGGTNTVEIRGDATTGHIYAVTASATTAANIIYLVWGEASTRPEARAAENVWYKALLKQQTAPVGGTQDEYSGLVGTNAGGIPTGLKDGIYFRATGTGNWFLVCRNGGSESTVDMGVAPSTTLLLLEFRVSGDGNHVTAYLDGKQVGSPISTNIPTGLFLIVPLHHDNRAATVTTAGAMRCYGWGLERDCVA